MTTSHPHFLNL